MIRCQIDMRWLVPTALVLLLWPALARAQDDMDRLRPKYWSSPAAGGSASGDPEILFTFDDGPDALRTPKILDVLAEHDVKAVFFMVGHHLRGKRNREVMPPIVRRLLAEGHTAGNHTVEHVHLCGIPQAEGDREMDENARLIREATGVADVKFFRAPYGDRCIRLENMLAVRRLKHLHWDIDPREWMTQDPEETAGHIIDRIRVLPEGARAVVLLHDTQHHTVDALPRILEWIREENRARRARGIRPVRIIGPADIARDRLAADLLPLVDDTLAGMRGLFPDLAGRLLLPLAGGEPPATARTARPRRP